MKTLGSLSNYILFLNAQFSYRRDGSGGLMQVELRIWDTTRRDVLRAYVERRLRFGLSRFGNRIGRVVVRIGRHNGAEGASETSCHIEVRLAPLGSVTVKERGTDLFAAIDRAVERIERLVAHRVVRAR
jgi:putative sigma-54 modulation protein